MYAVTGSTGAIGGRVAAQLAQQRHDLRLVVQDADQAPHLEGVDVEEADYADFEAMRAALVGIDTLFLVSSDEAQDRVQRHITTVDAAAAAGVRRIVYLSSLAAGPDATFDLARDHWATEEYIRGIGLVHTFLRPSLDLDVVPSWATGEGVFSGPAGAGRIAWVSRDDLADVAVVSLTGTGHDGQTYNVTGPEALTLEETAAVLSAAAGREVRYVQQTLEEVRASDPEGEARITSFAAIAAGELDQVSDVVDRLAGHPPISLRDHLKNHPELLAHLAG